MKIIVTENSQEQRMRLYVC